MPPSTSKNDWPFFAKTIFTQMGVPQIQEVDTTVEIEESAESIENKMTILVNLGFTDCEINLEILKSNSFDLDRTINCLLEQNIGGEDIDMLPTVPIQESAESIENKMTILTNLDFTNREVNLEILKRNSFDLDRTINYLLEQNSGYVINESEILINNKLTTLSCLGFGNAELNAEILKKNLYDLNKCINELMELLDASASQIDHDLESQTDGLNRSEPISKAKMDVSESTDCPICSDEDVSAANWSILQCGHKLCCKCCKQIETTRTTMSGVTYTFTKCPFCMKTSGVEVGLCPDGSMTILIVSTPCQGYESYQSIKIQYDIQSQAYQLHRVAYLPNSDEGNELLKLLRIAWDRRICFTIGTSVTDGREDVLVWNIHHKTALNGGVQSHGFPDETYMERCRSELKAFGIE